MEGGWALSLGLFTVELELYKKGDTRHVTKTPVREYKDQIN